MTQASPHPTTRPADDVGPAVRGFLARHTKRDWEPDEDLFASGAISSLFAMQLVVFLENTFDLEIGGDDLTLANFRTIDAMAALVARLRGGPGDA